MLKYNIIYLILMYTHQQWFNLVLVLDKLFEVHGYWRQLIQGVRTQHNTLNLNYLSIWKLSNKSLVSLLSNNNII